MISTELQAMKAAAMAKFDVAIEKAEAYETVNNRQTRDEICAALQAKIDHNNDENTAIYPLMALVPCGA